MSLLNTVSLSTSEEEFSERIRMFTEFFESQAVFNEGGDYKEKIEKMLNEEKRRLVVNINDLRAFNPELTKK